MELLIVVAILAILVALAMPFFQDYLARSRLTAAKADLANFQKALASYDQLENQMFSSGLWSDLIGKYLQDFRAFATQTAPLDPWSNSYQVHTASGTLLSVGPNGSKETTGREPLGDDIVVSWKPEFFISGVSKVGNNQVDLSFTRKIKSISAVNVANEATAGASTEYLKISDTVYRFSFGVDLPVGTFTVDVTTNTIEAQDGKMLLDTDKKPDGISLATTATFTPQL